MRRKGFLRAVVVLPVLAATLFILATCQKAEQIEEAASTLAAEVQATMQPEPTIAAEIPPEESAEESAEEPVAEAVTAIEPEPTEVPKATATDLEEYLSVTEFFSVNVPAGWSTGETFPGGAFIMANSEAALERHNNGGAVEQGDLVLNVGFLPFELLQQRELAPLGIQFEATPDVFLQSLLPMFRISGDAVLGDAELVSLSDERDAGMLTVSEEGREGMILMFMAGDGVVAFVSTVGFPGEMAEFQDIAHAVAAEVTFSGDQQVLYGTFLGG